MVGIFGRSLRESLRQRVSVKLLFLIEKDRSLRCSPDTLVGENVLPEFPRETPAGVSQLAFILFDKKTGVSGVHRILR